MQNYDYIIIGSGLNSLVCASLLAKNKNKILVLERNAQLGGCIKSDREMAFGFTIDLMSTSHVQFLTSPAYAELSEDLAKAGMEYCFTQTPTGVITPDGKSIVLTTDNEENMQRIGKINEADAQAYINMIQTFGANSNFIFGLLGSETRSWGTIKSIFGEWRARGFAGLLEFFKSLLNSTRRWVEADFASAEMDALVAPMSLHCGLGPETTMSALMGQVVTFSLTQAGDPLVKGGSDNIVKAFQKIIEENGGTLKTSSDVTQVDVKDGRAVGIKLANGEQIDANKGVIGNVTPTQLYQNLLAGDQVPEAIAQSVSNYEYGRGCMMIHIAMDAKPQWSDPEMAEVAMMHVCGGVSAVNKAVSEAERGLLADQPTICVVQPVAVDPSRAPDGKWILWLQLLETPKKIIGDVRGEIIPPADGKWTEAVREQFADRVIADLNKHITNLEGNIIARKVLSPADLEGENINLVGGDPYSGSCEINQSFIFRPLPTTKNHKTPIKGLYHIGASTHPGPGLGGMSGYLTAKNLI